MREIKRVLITGATGMIGATLTRLLLQENIEVYAVHRPGSPKLGNLPEGHERLHLVPCDNGALKTLLDCPNALPDTVDAVFHFAWEKAYGAGRNDVEAQNRNAEASLTVYEIAKKLKAKVFLGAGSQAEYGHVEGKLTEFTETHPVTEYGKAKLRTQEALFLKNREENEKNRAVSDGTSGSPADETAATVPDVIWTRILSVYGPYDNAYTMVSSALQAFTTGEHFATTKGDQIWDYLYSEDAARAFYELAKSGRNRRIYVLGHGEERTLRSYIEAIRDAVDPSIQVGFGERPYNENQVMYLTADISALKEDTGYSPETPFETGIENTLNHLLKKDK